MIRALGLVVGVALLLATPAIAQPGLSDAGLAAEASGRWADAVGIYREVLQGDPGRADLWVRVSDIEAFLGNAEESVSALVSATEADPTAPALHQRLSQAYAANGAAEQAVAAIDVALVLAPDNLEYLRATATLTTWVGDYAAAASAFRRIDSLEAADENTLKLARVSAWAGETDEAVGAYRRYLSTNEEEAEVWIEFAVAEYWRGNYGASHETLEAYDERFGATAEQQQELAAVFARAGKPSRSLQLLAPLLMDAPDDYDLNFIRTAALAMQPRPTEAFDSLDTTREIDPAEGRNRSAGRLLRAALGSAVGPAFSTYSDSDNLEIVRYAAEAEFALATGTDLRAGFERHELDSRVGSGLEQASGAATAEHEQAWFGIAQRIRAVVIEGRLGRASAEQHQLTSYGLGVQARPTDALNLSFNRSRDYFVISPRTVGLGVDRVTHRADIEWTPGLENYVGFQAAYHEVSDGNHLLEFTFAPRRHIVRNEWLNLDIGFSAYQYRAHRDLDTGYYDPEKYEFYGLAVYPYWKANEDIGVSFTVVAGAQRHDETPDFSAAGNAAVRAIFGIYGPLVLDVSVAATFNRRLESGAFRGFRGGASLALRF